MDRPALQQPELPNTLATVDHEIEQLRVAVRLVQRSSQPMIWERIDLLLDRRLAIQAAIEARL